MKNNFQKELDKLLAKAELPTTKQKFIIDIEEMIVQSFEVEAESMEEAMEIAEEKYWKGEFVLEADADVAARQMRASSEGFEEQTEWTEF